MDTIPAVPQASAVWDWTCDVCHKPIRDGGGYVQADSHAATDLLRRERDEQATLREKYPDEMSIPLSEITLHAPVKWSACHQECDPEPNTDTYWVATDRLRTTRDVLSFAAHMAGKRWTRKTDLLDFLAAHAGGRTFF